MDYVRFKERPRVMYITRGVVSSALGIMNIILYIIIIHENDIHIVQPRVKGHVTSCEPYNLSFMVPGYHGNTCF